MNKLGKEILKILFVLWIIMAGGKHFLNAQSNFSHLIPFPYGSPNPTQITLYDGIFYIPTIQFSPSSAITIFDENDYSYQAIDSNVLGRKSFHRIGSKYLLFTSSDDVIKQPIISIYDLEFNPISQHFIPKSGDPTGITTAFANSNAFYGAYLIDTANFRYSAVAKLDTFGNIEFNIVYNRDKKLAFPWQITAGNNDRILLSSGIVYTDRFGRYGQVIQLRPDGSVDWVYEGNEPAVDGGEPFWVLNFDDSLYLQGFRVDRRFDNEFFINGWTVLPNYIEIINNQGALENNFYILFPDDRVMSLTGMKRATDTTFYLYGNMNVTSNPAPLAWIGEYTIDGDSLWTRQITHIDYPEGNHSIEDIVVTDSFIYILAGIGNPINVYQMWLFRLDRNGCATGQNCNNRLYLNVESAMNKFPKKVSVYPNPTLDYLQIDVPTALESAEYIIVNQNGQIVLKGILEQNSINVQSLHFGKYIGWILDGKENQYSFEFVKL